MVVPEMVAEPGVRAMRSVVLSAAVALATIGALLVPAAATAQPAAKSARTVSATALLQHLKVAPADRKHRYASTTFADADADLDGCSTRQEVLNRDAGGTIIQIDNCTVAGVWRSFYDGKKRTDPAAVVVDRLVPNREAWRSGAWRWTDAQRTAFANDLGYKYSLRVATTKAVASRGSKDPARWLPKKDACTYAKAWVAVKSRWHLSVDRAEKAALVRTLATCTDPRIRKPGTPDVVALTGVKPTKAISLPANPKVYFFGDSWTNGATADEGQGFPYVLGRSLGWQVQLGPNNSGAGFVHTYDPSHPLLADSAAQLDPFEADLVVLEGGLNDEPGPLTDFIPNLMETIASLRERSGGARIVMVGPASPDGVTPRSLAAIDSQEAAVARKLGIHYISPVQEGWLTPDNVQTLVDPQTYHPNTAGHAYYAGRLAADLRRFVRTAVVPTGQPTVR
jgi:lysophospholipase L1-like esterase